MRFLSICSAVCLLALQGCGNEASTVASSETAAPSVPAEPTHNYALKEGTTYGYEGGISEEDKQNGKVAAEVHLFRYLGEKGGVYTVQMVEEDGSEILKASCTKPCEFMKLNFGGNVQRVKYDTDSLGGSVIEDALSGQLDLYKPQSANG